MKSRQGSSAGVLVLAERTAFSHISVSHCCARLPTAGRYLLESSCLSGSSGSQACC